MSKKRAHRIEVEQQILKLTQSRFMRLSEIAAALQMPSNTVRAKYLYRMTKEGLLERQYPKRTNLQAYKAVLK